MRHCIPFLLLLAGCTTSGPALSTVAVGPTTTTIETATGTHTLTSVGEMRLLRGVVNAPVDRVWSALPMIFAELEIPAAAIREDQRTFGNPGLHLNGRFGRERPSRYLECGTNPIGVSAADSYSLDIQLVTSLQPSGATATRYQVQLTATATPRAGGSRSTCATTGELERRIAQRLDDLFR